jgi:hypothetical protein
MSTTTLPCGCKHNDRSWLVLCEAHLLEWLDTHSIAGLEHRPTQTDESAARQEMA